jgi:deoxycytidine triphosphate deaminase/intein/homing endonuclease
VILSDRDLRAEIEAGRLVIEPFDPDAVQPSSVDLRVGDKFRVFANHRYPHIDVRKPLDNLTELVEATEDEPFILHPGEFVLGTTLETVTLPDNLVARLEGKSSLGRLGLLIHSSLPGTEPVLFLSEGHLDQLPIEQIVRKRLGGRVVSFDPDSFEVIYADVTGWHETAADRIYEVTLASGRRVRLTGGHCLFTLDPGGDVRKARVQELSAGLHVAIAGCIPDPPAAEARLDLLALAPESEFDSLVCGGPTVAGAFATRADEVEASLREAGILQSSFYRDGARVPLAVAMQHHWLTRSLGPDDWLSFRGERHRLPVVIEVDEELSWFLGLFVARGFRRGTKLSVSTTDQDILDRTQAVLARFRLPGHREEASIAFCSALMAHLMSWLGLGTCPRTQRMPRALLGWPKKLLSSFLDGYVDGNGSREKTRICLWTSSQDLAGDLLLLCTRLGKQATSSRSSCHELPTYRVALPYLDELEAPLPNCDRLLLDNRRNSRPMPPADADGFHAARLDNIEARRCDAISLATLRRLRDRYASSPSPSWHKLSRLVDGNLRWDEVVDVVDTGSIEPVFDLEVRPSGCPTENFLAGHGGVLVSNTAGFVDAGFSGQLTLELSNVANLPIAIYPGMLVGQLCLFRMTSPAEHPYGSDKLRSKYQAQRGPTASRFHENFRD